MDLVYRITPCFNLVISLKILNIFIPSHNTVHRYQCARHLLQNNKAEIVQCI